MDSICFSFQLLDAQSAETDLQGFVFLADAVDLEADETRRRHCVLEIGGPHAVEPGFDGIAPAFDAEVVPLTRLEGLPGCFIVLEVGKPTAPAFIINAARPRPGRR